MATRRCYAFPADEIVIATHPEARSHWLSRDLVTRARRRFGLPVGHVVVPPAEGAPVRHRTFSDRSQAVLKPR